MKKLSYFTISLLFHVALMSLAVLFVVVEPDTPLVPLEVVTHIEPPHPPRQRSSHFSQTAHAKKLARTSKLSNQEMGRRILIASGALFDEKAAWKASSSPFVEALNDNMLYSEAEGDLFGDNDNWAFHQQVYKSIDSELVFDSILARFNHFGVVYLEFAVDQKGYLLEKTLRASAQDPILKVHAVRALRRGLDTQFEDTKWSVLSSPIVFRAKFEFTHEDFKLNFKKQNAFSDPIFVFRRATQAGDVASNNAMDQSIDNLGDLFDPEQTINKLKNRQRNRVIKAGDYDPFASYRSDPAYAL